MSQNGLWNRYAVTIKLRNKLCGGIPKSTEMIDSWLRAKKKKLGLEPNEAETQAQAAKTATEMGLDLEETVTGMSTGFKSDPEHGLYIEGRQVKAMLKESASVMGVTTNIRGAKNYLTQGVFVKVVENALDRIYLGVKEPSGTEETVIQINSAQGKRSAFKQFDYVVGATISFELWLLKRIDGKEMVPVDMVKLLLQHGEESGLGSNRTQGYGTFDVVAFEGPLDEVEVDPWKGMRPLGKKAGSKASKGDEADEE